MEEFKLDVQIRDQIGSRKVKAIHREDCVPAIVYGGKKKGPTAIKVDRRAYERIMRDHQGQSVVFHLNVMEGEKKLRDYAVIVKEEQHAPVSDKLQHIDFHRISLTEELEVKVPIVTKGEAAGVKNDGGSLDHTVWELDIVCLPTNIPEKISIDVTELGIGDAIHVKDIVLPEGVKTMHDSEAILVSVVPPMKEVEAPAEGEEENIEPEVIKEKKAEEGDEEKDEKKAEENP
ncbi:MAG: 50S ribosomal protein L25 [Candidatus Omnitrophica bacterium]|nr:50S ribosomal protein L25 [Candidatus Omnitrophota bacterium]